MDAERIIAGLSDRDAPPTTSVDRTTYLDLAERIVRQAVTWQNAWGVIVDPYRRFHAATSTPRFVGALGQLIGAGRCADLVHACIRGYEHALACITDPVVSPEFAVKELVFAHQALSPRVSARRRARWEASWRDYDGGAAYNAVRNDKVGNFNTFALLSEFTRLSAGLGGDPQLVDRLIEKELARFDDQGMYQDPDCPMTYHIVVLQQWVLLLLLGYEGQHAATVRDLVRRGGMAALLLQSAAGQAPAGGRSNQFHFVEAQMAALFEGCARLACADGDPALAGACKRAARRGVALMRPWIVDMKPFRHLKHGFHPELDHGTDSGGHYGVYGILIASLLGTAARVADESIAERFSPPECGGYIFLTRPPFHQVVAACGGWSIQIDTRANLAKDATGLIRVHRLGLRPETILAGGISSRPGYVFAFDLPQRNVAIGPEWRADAGGVERLADLSDEIAEFEVAVLEQNPRRVWFEIVYRGMGKGIRLVRERYELTAAGLRYEAAVEPGRRLFYTVPVIVTDGEACSAIAGGPHGLSVAYRDGRYTLAARRGSVSLTDEFNTNRNATYRTAVVRPDGHGPPELVIGGGRL